MVLTPAAEAGSRRRIRDVAIAAGFGVATRLRRLGLARLTFWARQAVARLTGDHVTVRVEGATLGGSLIHHGSYLTWLSGGPLADHYRPQLDLFREPLAPGMLAVDCGAHIGLFTVLAADRLTPGGTIVALEPDPVNLKALRENVEANELTDTVEVVAAAASDRSGTASLYAIEDRTMHGISTLSKQPGVAPIEVSTVTIDELLAGRRLDAAKIDVEGAEDCVVRGMEETLRRSPGAVILIECHPPELGGPDRLEWLAGLRERGSVELVDFEQGRLVAATDDEISATIEQAPGWPFHVRWTVGDAGTAGP